MTVDLTNPFKLEKLKIKAFTDEHRKKPFDPPFFEVMFNPESFKENLEIEYDVTTRTEKKFLNSSGQPAKYFRNKPLDLNLKLIIDGTGVDHIGLVGIFKKKKVSKRVKEFVDLAWKYNGDIHEPNFLVVEWGNLIFSCRLKSVEINYTLFDRDGTPLRAELDASFIADKPTDRLMKLENKTSPDLTHRRIIKNGETLPLLSKEIYGSSTYYLRVAQANNLDDFRNLTPGQEIVFPPFEKTPVSQ